MRSSGEALLEPARLVALREYISLWERGLGTHEAFVTRALDALFTHGVTDKALYLLAPFPEIRADLTQRVRTVLVTPLAPTATGARATSETTRASLAAWLLLTCLAVLLAGCKSPYEGLWQTSDRSVTLSLDVDHGARWNVYLGPDPNAHGDATQGDSFRLWQGQYQTTATGVRLTLHCAVSGAGNPSCADPQGDVDCVHADDTLTCTFDGQPSRLGRTGD